MDNTNGGEEGGKGPARNDEYISPDLSTVRSGELAPHSDRGLPARVEDSSAISPGRAIPPAEVTNILDRYRHVDAIEAMIPVFQELQTKYGYITQAVADQVCAELGLAEAEVYGVLTFYSFFRYTPRAGHVIMSCEGTGCYVRGAANVREAIENRLDVGPGDTTADGHWTFEPQSICLGACDLAPLVEIEGRYYSHVTPEKMDAIITQWEDAGEFSPVGDYMTGGMGHMYEDNHGFGPRSEELYAGYEVERFMPDQKAPAASATQAPPEVKERIQNTPPTPNPGGASGSQSQS
ncbi:MAG: NAD(P)H-dependent oxidoreductase subunit E [Chloroflexota bacterium]